jgi:hypothetical protein
MRSNSRHESALGHLALVVVLLRAARGRCLRIDPRIERRLSHEVEGTAPIPYTANALQGTRASERARCPP